MDRNNTSVNLLFIMHGCKNAYFKKKVIKVILLFCFAGLHDSLSNKMI